MLSIINEWEKGKRYKDGCERRESVGTEAWKPQSELTGAILRLNIFKIVRDAIWPSHSKGWSPASQDKWILLSFVSLADCDSPEGEATHSPTVRFGGRILSIRCHSHISKYYRLTWPVDVSLRERSFSVPDLLSLVVGLVRSYLLF